MNYKETREKFNVWWAQLEQREQRMVAVGAVAVGFFILYVLIWMPIQNHLAEMRTSIMRDQKTLAWMKAANQQINSMEGEVKEKAKTITPVELLGIVQDTIEEAGLTAALKQSKQSSSDAIVLHFQKADFDRLIAMLVVTLKEQNVTVTQFNATATKDPGVVNADLTLKIG